MFILILNRTNLVGTDNNQLVYNFPNSVKFKDDYIAVSSISIYYSWFNISLPLANQYLSYTWYDGAVKTTYTITIPAGLYEIVGINNFIISQMYANGTYLLPAPGTNSGNDYFFFDLQVNPTRYGIQLNTYLLPTAADLANPVNTYFGCSYPAGHTPPTVSYNPQVSFNPINNDATQPYSQFHNIVGYATDFVSAENLNNSFVVPAGNTLIAKSGAGTISYLSTQSPEVQPNSSLYFTSSLVNNTLAQPTGIIYSLTPNVAIGGIINERPPQYLWNKIIDGTYNQIRVSILGTDLRPIKIEDPAMTILLAIRSRDEGLLSAKN
jgi:hypothetical protein